jgi:hypothetical protein
MSAVPAPMAAPVVIVEGDGGACCAPNCGHAKTVCVPEHYCQKTTKAVYSSVCEPVCLCFFPSLFGHCGCEDGHCEHPRTRKFLVKKIQTCEHDAIRCVPSEAACEHGCCPAAGAYVVPGAPVMMAPAMAPPAGRMPAPAGGQAAPMPPVRY